MISIFGFARPDARSLHPITHYVNMIMGLLSILCSFSLKSYHSMCKFYSFFNLTVCVVRTAKSPPVEGRAGPDKDFLGKFKKQPVLLSAAICSPPAFSFINKYHDLPGKVQSKGTGLCKKAGALGQEYFTGSAAHWPGKRCRPFPPSDCRDTCARQFRRKQGRCPVHHAW